MLCIATDIDNPTWLKYITEEFCRIQGAEFEIEVVPLSEVNTSDSGNYLYYIKEPTSELAICNRSEVAFSNKLTFLGNHKFVFSHTVTAQKGFLILFDIFYNAFLFLSRFEEFHTEKQGKRIRSYCYLHPRENNDSFLIPIVNVLFRELELLIKTHFPSLVFNNGNIPIVELSHDVDYINKTNMLRFKQTTFNTFNGFRGLLNPAVALKLFQDAVRFLVSTPSYWCFDYWVKLEKSMDKRSVFYFYSHTPHKKSGFSSFLVDPSYNIEKNQLLQDKVKYLINEGFIIGLHGSYKSAENEALIKEEKEILEKVTGSEIRKVRQHWLNYVEQKTPYLHASYFQEDSTIGWNDTLGFRSGCASRYRPFDHNNQRPLEYFVIPLIVMDSNIYDYHRTESEKYERQCLKMLQDITQFKNVQVSLSWHQRVCNSDYNWHLFYEKILRDVV